MSSNDSGRSGGMSFTGALAILFIGLKLAGIIDWPWVWVLSPLWIGLAIAVLATIAYVAAESCGRDGHGR